jgi:hypothetical protein
MSQLPTGYSLPKNASEMTDEELKANLMADYKQMAVKKSNFPTEVIPLPSKGLLYPEGHPLAEGTIEMKYMTAREEDILTSQNLIKQGVVLDKLFESLIVTPFNYNEIYSGDKNAIMIAARILGYGKDYVVDVDDPTSAGTKQKVTIDLTQIEHKEVDYSLFQDRKNEFEFQLPQSNRVITFRLTTHGIEKQIETEVKSLTKQMNKTGIDKSFTTRLKHMIVSVDGEYGRNTINNFVDNELFAVDSRALRAHIKEMSPDIDMTFTFISDTTGEALELAIPMDISFFWPNT